MSKTIANYLNQKINLLPENDTIRYKLIDYLYNNSCDYYCKEYTDGTVAIMTVHEAYTPETNCGRNGTKAHYAHIINNNVDNVADYISNFVSINGEVCFSDICCGDVFLQHHNAVYGVVMLATPTRSFDYDCWSYIDNCGKRYATKKDYDGNDQRHEHWINPAKSQLVGLIYNEKTEKEVKALCNQLHITAYDISWL